MGMPVLVHLHVRLIVYLPGRLSRKSGRNLLLASLAVARSALALPAVAILGFLAIAIIVRIDLALKAIVIVARLAIANIALLALAIALLALALQALQALVLLALLALARLVLYLHIDPATDIGWLCLFFLLLLFFSCLRAYS